MDKTFFEIISNFKSIKNVDKYNTTFTFSTYKNGEPGSGKSEHRNIIRDKLFTEDFIRKQILKLDNGWEFAFNSLITFNHTRHHLPLIDFYCDNINDLFYESIKDLKAEYNGDIYIFSSGKSYHGYHDILLTESEWEKYLGSLLLLNKMGFRSEIIDSRWVGHSLKQGYSSLRISHNTTTYLKRPEFIMQL